MSDNITSIFLAFFVVCAPVWIVLHYISKMRGSRQLNAQDAAALETMLASTQRLEQRVQVLEQILDSEVPDWRNHPANFRRAS